MRDRPIGHAAGTAGQSAKLLCASYLLQLLRSEYELGTTNLKRLMGDRQVLRGHRPRRHT
jgi:hypothetical protein